MRRTTAIMILLYLVVIVVIVNVALTYIVKIKQGAPKGPAERLSLEGARKAIQICEYPTKLNGYTFGDSTGIYPNWNTDSSELGEMCELLARGLRYAYHHPNEEKGKKCVLIFESFLIRYSEELKKKIKHQKFPWGSNWYQFSVSSTSMMAYYLLLSSPTLKDMACDTILTLITSPTVSLGWTRDGVNAIYLIGPYLLAKYHKREINDALFQTKEYKYIESLLELPIQRKQGGEGLHMDLSYIFHKDVVCFSYLSTLDTHLTRYFYGLDTKLTSDPRSVCQKVKNIIIHPSIPISSMGVTGRRLNLDHPINATSPYGIKVIPGISYLRYFTKDFSFSVRGQKSYIAFFESDRWYYKQAQYWTQYRNVHTMSSKPEIKFPDPGFICKSDVLALIEIPSSTMTTQSFKPTAAKSFVVAWEQYGVLWQEYTIKEFGSPKVTELIVVDSKENTITIDVIIVGTGMVYYGATSLVNLEEYRSRVNPLPVTPNTHFKTVFNLNNKTVVTETLKDGDVIKLFPQNLDTHVSVYMNDSYGILKSNGKAKVVCPMSDLYELENFVVPDMGMFTFNTTLNQYIGV